MFIVEGIITVMVAPIFFFFFPQTPREAWFLTAEEKEMMRLRYELEPHWGIDEKFTWNAVINALLDPKFHAQ